LHGGQLLFGAGDGGLESLGFAEPSLVVCLGESGVEVVEDLMEAVPLGGVGPEERAADAGVFVFAGGAVSPFVARRMLATSSITCRPSADRSESACSGRGGGGADRETGVAARLASAGIGITSAQCEGACTPALATLALTGQSEPRRPVM
jgi:hypothetical protein